MSVTNIHNAIIRKKAETQLNLLRDKLPDVVAHNEIKPFCSYSWKEERWEFNGLVFMFEGESWALSS